MPGLLQRTLTLATLTTLPAIACADNLYKVEMLVFANESGIGIQDEYWPDVTPVDTSGAVFTRSWDGYPLAAYEELPRNDLRLGNDAALLARSGRYQVLYHRGWLQSISRSQKAPSVRIKASTGKYELDGSINIYRNRFLHARPNLQLSQHSLPAPVSTETDAPITPDYRPSAWLLQDARRMRSKEIHYIDHPKMGILLMIRPVSN